MRLVIRLAVLGAVAAAASVGVALAAHNGIVNGNLGVCVHQNGGAVTVQGQNGCAGQDSAVSLVTPEGTVQNALTLDGKSAQAFLQANGGTYQSGFLRMACVGAFPANTHDVQVQDFGLIEFQCGTIPNVGGEMSVSMQGSSGRTFGSIEDPTLGQSIAKSFDFASGSVGFGVCCGSQVFGQARNRDAGPTVSLHATIVPELGELSTTDEAQHYWDVLYEVTES